jgi:superfamily II DNA or RNA helicase
MLGLSATPDERIDGLDQINIWHCGPVLNACELDGYTEDDIPFKGEVKMVKYLGPDEYTKIITNKTLDIVSFSEMVTQLCEDPYRIHLIVKTIYELRKNDMQVLVFADRRSYLENIKNELEKFHINSDILDDVDIKSQRVVGGASAEDVEHAELFSNVILSTYSFFGTGKSIPKLDSIILTTPRKRKSKQYIGRIFRLGSDYSITRQIIDIVDWKTPMKSQWYKRKKFYEEMDYPITESKIQHDHLEKEMVEMNIICTTDTEPDTVDQCLRELELLLSKNIILDLKLPTSISITQ